VDDVGALLGKEFGKIAVSLIDLEPLSKCLGPLQIRIAHPHDLVPFILEYKWDMHTRDVTAAYNPYSH
jgi:hypothetical protein